MAFPFRHNETVEISRKQEGFFGSHYPAKVLAAIGRNKFLVRYQTLLTDDKSRLLTEALDAGDVRPLRPEIPVSKFEVGDRIDACHNGGWWVGRISRKVDPNYYVRFDSKGNELHCAFYRVRLHLDWVDGKWVYPPNGPKDDDGEEKEGEHKLGKS